MKKSNLYTATGDGGTTSLVGGERVMKTDARLEAYGTVDELNSFLGLLAAADGLDSDTLAVVRGIQNHLFNIGAYLATGNDGATPREDADTAARYGIDITQVEALEHEIDRVDSLVAPLNRFLLPGGSDASARAQVCRAVARRAERRIIALGQTHRVADAVLKYINRLSDYLFALARYLNKVNGVDEVFWEK